MDVQSLDPPLLAKGECDEEAELDQFGLGKVVVQFRPQGVVGEFGIPRNRLCVGKCRLLPFLVLRRVAELEQVRVLLIR